MHVSVKCVVVLKSSTIADVMAVRVGKASFFIQLDIDAVQPFLAHTNAVISKCAGIIVGVVVRRPYSDPRGNPFRQRSIVAIAILH